jgi:FtsP/CotA-like multicopper oxidase with cupredoxin domain
MSLGFADGRTFHLVGTDADLLGRPVELSRLTLSPGERADIVVTFRRGDAPALLETNDENDRSGLVLLRPADVLTTSPPLPGVLNQITPLGREEAVASREFEMRGQSINRRSFDMDRVDFTVKPGSVERWTIIHPGGGHHNFHVHGARFQIAAVNGASPPPELSGWKDTIDVPPEQSVELLVRFADHDNPQATLVYHCHNLAHEDGGMMGQFLLTSSATSTGSEHVH